MVPEEMAVCFALNVVVARHWTPDPLAPNRLHVYPIVRQPNDRSVVHDARTVEHASALATLQLPKPFGSSVQLMHMSCLGPLVLMTEDSSTELLVVDLQRSRFRTVQLLSPVLPFGGGTHASSADGRVFALASKMSLCLIEVYEVSADHVQESADCERWQSGVDHLLSQQL